MRTILGIITLVFALALLFKNEWDRRDNCEKCHHWKRVRTSIELDARLCKPCWALMVDDRKGMGF